MSLHPLRQRWVSAADSWISVRESEPAQSGAGTIVFLHGRLSCSEFWRPVQDRLRARFRCLLVDFPPSGLSVSHRTLTLGDMTEIVAEVLAHHCAEPVLLVGHDTGGAVAQSLAIRASDRIAGLVLVNSGSLSGPLGTLPCGWPAWRLRRKLERMIGSSPGMTREDWAEMRSDGSDTAGFRQLRHAIAAIQESWPDAQTQRDLGIGLSALRVPVLLLWGGKDPLVTPQQGFDLIRKIPSASFQLRSESGHWPFLDSPEWVAGRLREFSERCKGWETRTRSASRGGRLSGGASGRS